ncbi:MAG: ABC transporter substrate-binding protein [SAR324 cluster bacterium]|nr:ABC transporter substrate-binding protein [SAR324 cluster bacterium]
MNRMTASYATLGLLLLATVFIGGQCGGESGDTPGVTDKTIKVGNTNPYSGPASSYGTIGRAIEGYFKMVNEQGGINGRQIEFITYDDGYSPPKTVEQIRRLVEQDEVAFLFQTLGTPTNTAIWEYVNQKKVPHLFVATGATKWGDPQGHPWTIGFQPNYQTESKIYAKYILEKFPNAKIGILYQNDDYGKDYLLGFKDGLGEAGQRMIVAEVSYEVTDPTIDSQIVSLKASGADVFFNISIPKFAAQSIRKISEIGWKPVHFLNNVSQSVAAVMKPAGLKRSKGIISTRFFKDPSDPEWADDPAVIEWRKWIGENYPDGNPDEPFNAYAYIVSQLLHHVIEKCGDNLSRENIMAEAANIKDLELSMLLPGMRINTSSTDFYPIEQMQLMKFDGERWRAMGGLIDTSSS